MHTSDDMIRRRQEKQAEQPMATSLRDMALKAAADYRAADQEARTRKLCECHGHTLHEALVEATAMDWGWRMERARNAAAVDVPTMLRRAGCPENAIQRIGQGKLELRPSLVAARAWLGGDPQPLGITRVPGIAAVEAQRMRQHRRPFLGMFGETDRGKTLAAVYCMARAMKGYSWNTGATGARPQFPFAFVRMTELAATLAWTQETREWLERLKRAHTVVLDDMGKEHLSPVGKMILFDLLDARYGQGLSTIITSQAKIPAFQLAYDGPVEPGGRPGAIFRRLRERGLILQDGGDRAGAVLLRGEIEIKRWPKTEPAP